MARLGRAFPARVWIRKPLSGGPIAYTLAGAVGAFTISGQTATELRGITSASSEGAFVISGQTAGLQVGLPGAEGVFTISGQAGALNKALHEASAEGAFVISGKASTELRGITSPSSEGAFVISGQAAGLNVGLPGVEGAFVIGGQVYRTSRHNVGEFGGCVCHRWADGDTDSDDRWKFHAGRC